MNKIEIKYRRNNNNSTSKLFTFLNSYRKDQIKKDISKNILQLECKKKHDSFANIILTEYLNNIPFWKIEIIDACCNDFSDEIQTKVNSYLKRYI